MDKRLTVAGGVCLVSSTTDGTFFSVSPGEVRNLMVDFRYDCPACSGVIAVRLLVAVCTTDIVLHVTHILSIILFYIKTNIYFIALVTNKVLLVNVYMLFFYC